MGNYCHKAKKHQNFKVLNNNGSCQPFIPEVTNLNYLQSTGVQTKNESLSFLSKSVQCSYSPELKRFTSTNKRTNLNQSHPISVGNKEELNSSIYEDKLTTSSKWKCISPHCNTKNNLFCKTCSTLSTNKQLPKQCNEAYPILSNDMANNINERFMMNKPFEAGGDYKSTSSHTYPPSSYFHGVQTTTNESAKLNRFHQFIRENHYCSGNTVNNQTSRPHLSSYETCVCKNSPAYHPISLYHPHALTHTCCEHKFLPGYIRNSEICLTQANRKYLLDDYYTSNWSNFKRRNSMLLLKPFNDQCFSMDNINSVNYQDKLLQNNFPYYHKPTICQMNHSSYHINHNNEILEMNYNGREQRLNDQTILTREHRSKSCEIPKSTQNLNITPCSRSYSLLSGKLARCASQSIATSNNIEYAPPPPSPVGMSRNQQDSRLNDEMKSSLNSSVNDTHWFHNKNTPSLHSINNAKMNYATNYSQRFEDSNILHNINNLPQVYDVPECRHYATPSSCYNLSHIMHQKYKVCKCFNCERHLFPEGDHHFMHYADSLQRLHGERRQLQHQQQQSCEFMKSSTHTSQPVEYWLNSTNSTMYNPMNHLDRKQNNPDNSDGVKPTPCKTINSKVNQKTTHNSSSGSVRSSGSHRQHRLSSTRNSHSSRSPSRHTDGTVKVVKSKVDLEPTMNNLPSNHNYYTTQSFKHRFFLKETCGIEKIISDPTDRRIRAICDRFRCDLEVYSKIPKNGYLQYVIDISSPNLWALHGCARALDSSLNWCLTPQLAV
ncbi:unnamed protein product [Trichobilharzia szidati]|nr:unnamed protein product [Trichobilharzia szidati]